MVAGVVQIVVFGITTQIILILKKFGHRYSRIEIENPLHNHQKEVYTASTAKNT